MKENLIILGTGIRTVGQMTVESLGWLEAADAVFYVVADPVASKLIQKLNPQGAVSMLNLYKEGGARIDTYHAMVDMILGSVREGKTTVGAFYGHPGVFAYPSHESIRRARAEGYVARMLPGISAEDCLFADLGVDPATNGCQSYEATDFLANGRIIDNASQVILWQIGVLGNATFQRYTYDLSSMPLLVERLMQSYPANHDVYIYEASTVVGGDPMICKTPLYLLASARLTPASTLYIPPCRATTVDPYYYSRMKMAYGLS
jgi:uncharacterized protein YabN with tetrapyrrole methylase and pyrophosphatase domain